LNVYRISDVRQIELHAAEPLVPDPGPFEEEIAIAKLKRYQSPGSNQIPAQLIQAGGEKLQVKIHKLIISIQFVLIYKKGDKTECSNYCGTSLLPTSYKILSNILFSRLSPYIY
jgi:hypothetical protein